MTIDVKQQVQDLVTRGRGYDEIKAAAGADSWVCVLAGQIKARVADLPRALEGGDYHTHNWGRLYTIEESTLQVGAMVQIGGKPYEVVANKSSSGDAWVPDYTWFVAIPVKSIIDEFPGFPVRVRSAEDADAILRLHAAGAKLVALMNPTREDAELAIAKWEALGDDGSLAMALAFREYLQGVRDADKN